ncbi:MAG: TraR/DksA C4-type zinc finger protein [Gammaproteobacteria bacterium]|nr:TraR/DksA C4-type zinc finger protein [Gammaproteobacteria bacterium]MDH3859761.1 TraR/DksA C4-type zinc finger protein [Gammaproteobacteria bacterium]
MNNQLNDKQIHRLREQLENQFNALWSEIGSELKGSAKERFLQIAGEVHDLEDSSVADLFADLNMTILDKHVQETRDINSALIRIDKGTYDICNDCGESIDFDRLIAYPTATRCVRCQDVYEKTHVEGMHSKL